MKDGKEKKRGIFSSIIQFFKSISKALKRNPAISKTVIWSLSLIILIISIGGGFFHKHRVELKRALTLSDINQEISFSRTGTKVQLSPQKRYKNMTIIPIKFDSSDKQSLNANDYFVGIEGRKSEKLSPNIKASLASFSSDGNMALVLKGNLPKQPIQIILRNDNNYSDSDEGSGTYLDWGKEQKTKRNVVAFTVNPKGNNVKIDKRINSDMNMKDLYNTSFGEQNIKQLNAEKKKTKDKIKSLENKKKEYNRQIIQLNKALERKENDYSLSKNENESSTGYESKLEDSDFDNLEKTDLSSSDMESERNTKINNYDSIKDNIKDENRNLEGIENKKNQEIKYAEKMDELTTISNRYEILK